MTEETPAKSPLALVALPLATLWLLTGACFKLFLGTPNDLPEVVKDLPMALGLTYQLAIAIELVFVVLALCLPRIGWMAIAAIYVVFELLLLQLVAAGADSCGCFGSKVTITPPVMMGIDGVLLVLLLASKPWKNAGAGLNKLLVLVLCIAGFALPFLFSREVKIVPTRNKPVLEDSTSGEAESPIQSETEPPVEPDTGSFTKGFTILDLESWVGELIYDTPLAELIEQDISIIPTEGLWVLWRADCDHCAEHLEELEANPPPEIFLTLVQLKQSSDTDENRVVHILPSGPTVIEVSLPDTLDYAVNTPGELRLEGAVIVSAEEGVGH